MSGFKLDVTPVSNKKDESEIFKEPSFIEAVENNVYFYSEIEREKVLQLVKRIKELNNSYGLTEKQLSLKEKIPINIYINSYGGSIFSGLSVVDEIINSSQPIHTIVDGCCASAATLFSVVGQKRLIKSHSYMLIHQLSSCCWGKHQEFLDEMENQKKLMAMIKNIYLQYTKLPEKKLSEILKHDLWFDAKTCMKYGLVDQII